MMNIQQLMQQAQSMQKKLQSSQEKMKNTTFIGESGNGAVKIYLNGIYTMEKVEINPTLLEVDNKEMLEDLIVVAYNNAKEKIDKENNDNLGSLAGNSSMLNGLF